MTELLPLPATGNVKKNIDILIENLTKWNKEYHVYDKPTVSDYTYDVWFNELVNLEAKFPNLKRLDSPTLRVGGKITSHDKVERNNPMLSLDNVFNEQELLDWVRLNLPESGTKLVMEPKVDGLAVSLIYKDGILVDASTRGDGKVGERVLDAVRTISDIPLKIRLDGVVEIRGEVYFKLSRFNEINDSLPEGDKYKHPRNLASATLKMKDIAEIKRRRLSFIPYTVITEGKGTGNDSHILFMISLEGFGFCKYCYATCHSDNPKLHERLMAFAELLTKGDTPYDGIVVKVVDLNLQKELGGSVRAPKWGVAYKLQENIAHAVLKDVKLQVGRTGVITPVAIIEPTMLSGALIENITLHNFNIVEELKLGIGDTLSIVRSGEVIPKVLGVVKHNHNYQIHLPEYCPSCKGSTRTDGRYRYCNNDSVDGFCRETDVAKLNYIYSKEVLDIKHLGDKLVEGLYRSQVIKHPSDIFNLDISELTRNVTGSDLVSKKIYESIQQAKSIEDYRVVLALCIPTIGKQKAKIISGVLKGDISRLDEVGEVSKQEVLNWLANGGETEIRKYLNYITPTSNIINSTGKFAGKNILLSGKYIDISRKLLEAKIKSLGGSTVSNPTITTDFALFGLNPTPRKLDKVLELNIPQLTLEDLK